MNHPTFSIRSQPLMTAVPRRCAHSCPEKPAYMILKICYLVVFFAGSTAVFSDDAEWRHFGGLLIGSMLSALGGLGLLLLPGKPIPRQIIQARLMANSVFGLGLGAAALYLAATWGVRTGPLFTVGCGFLCGIMGVVLVKSLEPVILRRAKRYIDPYDEHPRRRREEIPTERIDQ